MRKLQTTQPNRKHRQGSVVWKINGGKEKRKSRSKVQSRKIQIALAITWEQSLAPKQLRYIKYRWSNALSWLKGNPGFLAQTFPEFGKTPVCRKVPLLPAGEWRGLGPAWCSKPFHALETNWLFFLTSLFYPQQLLVTHSCYWARLCVSARVFFFLCNSYRTGNNLWVETKRGL